MPTIKQRKMPRGRTTKALQFLAQVPKWSNLKDLLFASLCSKTCHKFTPFPFPKKPKNDSKMTKMPLPEMHCTSNSLSHKLITRSLDPPAVDLGDSVGIHVKVPFNKKLRRQITPPNNHKVYIETSFSRKTNQCKCHLGNFGEVIFQPTCARVFWNQSVVFFQHHAFNSTPLKTCTETFDGRNLANHLSLVVYPQPFPGV